MPDLNLLITLDVLLAEGSVARAAQRLRLSPSAMSRALARLRAAFASGQIRGACDGCEWTELCSRIAADGFTGVRLQIPAGTADPAPEDRPGCNPHRP